MRNRNVILLSFLLFLYIAPSFLTMSYSDSTILAEQNTSKEFMVSDGGFWLSGWTYRQSILINGSVGAGTNYQICLNVTYNSNMQTDFDDIRFTDNDGKTLLDYWLEIKVNNVWAVFWVEVKDNLDSNLIIYMYYGYGSVSSASNGDTTFLFFDDFSGETINSTKWNITQGTEGYGGDLDQTNGKLYFNDIADENTMLRGNTGSTGATALELSLYWETAFQFRAIGWSENRPDGYFSYDGDLAIIETQAGDTIDCEDDGDNGHITDNPYLTTTIFNRLGFYYLSSSHHEFWVNRVEKQDYITSVPDATMYPFFGTHSADTDNEFSVDWVFIRSIIEIPPVFSSFGEIEEREWHEVGEAELVFSIPIDETALNWFLIILGMFMVPASTLYLVKGGKNNMSTDKVFYFIVAFLFGWGLIFIGVS